MKILIIIFLFLTHSAYAQFDSSYWSILSQIKRMHDSEISPPLEQWQHDSINYYRRQYFICIDSLLYINTLEKRYEHIVDSIYGEAGYKRYYDSTLMTYNWWNRVNAKRNRWQYYRGKNILSEYPLRPLSKEQEDLLNKFFNRP